MGLIIRVEHFIIITYINNIFFVFLFHFLLRIPPNPFSVAYLLTYFNPANAVLPIGTFCRISLPRGVSTKSIIFLEIVETGFYSLIFPYYLFPQL